MLHLKKLREARNLTQTKVANDINISRQSYSYYELDKRQADNEEELYTSLSELSEQEIKSLKVFVDFLYYRRTLE